MKYAQTNDQPFYGITRKVSLVDEKKTQRSGRRRYSTPATASRSPILRSTSGQASRSIF